MGRFCLSVFGAGNVVVLQMFKGRILLFATMFWVYKLLLSSRQCGELVEVCMLGRSK